MNEPRIHYQVSLTARQAFALFLGLLLALGLAYSLGVWTGLEAGPRAESAAAGPAAAAPPAARPSEAAPSSPGGNGGSPAADRSGEETPAAEPAVRTTIALFQDRTGEESPPPAASREPAPTVAPRADLWVQVLSLSSRRQAETRSVRLAARGYRVAVLPAQGLKGPVYRVRVGPFETREQAARAAERLSREEGTETWIVPSGQ